jgi:hypothetical protein
MFPLVKSLIHFVTFWHWLPVYSSTRNGELPRIDLSRKYLAFATEPRFRDWALYLVTDRLIIAQPPYDSCMITINKIKLPFLGTLHRLHHLASSFVNPISHPLSSSFFHPSILSFVFLISFLYLKVRSCCVSSSFISSIILPKSNISSTIFLIPSLHLIFCLLDFLPLFKGQALLCILFLHLFHHSP